MTIIKRADLGRPLTWDELDDNFQQVDNLTAAASAAVSSAAASATAAAGSATNSLNSASSASGSAADAAASAASAIDALMNSTFEPADFDFTTGGTLDTTDRNKAVYNPADNNWYSWSGTLPKNVSAGEDPTADSNWKPRTDQLLRQELAGTNGLDMVYGGNAPLSMLVAASVYKYMTASDISAHRDNLGAEINVDYALQDAVDDGVMELHFPPGKGIYVLGASPVTLPAGFSITGVSSKPYTTSSDASFNNRGTVLRLASGASSIFILTNRHRFFNVVFDGRDKSVNLMKGVGTDQTQYCRFDSCGIYRWLNGLGGSSSSGYTATLQVIGCSIASNYRGVRNVIDSRFTDCTVNANEYNGVELNSGANNNSFVNVRNEWNNGANYVSSGAKRNVINGELIDRAGLNAIVATNGGQWIVSGATIQRSGRLAVSGSADDSHLHVSGATSFIIIDGFYTLSGANDDGSGTVSPSYSLSGGGSSSDDKTFIASGGNLSGFTTAWVRPGTSILSLDVSACRGAPSTKNNGFFQIVDGSTQLGETITQSLSGTGNSVTFTFQTTAKTFNQYSQPFSRVLNLTARNNTSTGSVADFSIRVLISRESSNALVAPIASTVTSYASLSGGTINIPANSPTGASVSFSVSSDGATLTVTVTAIDSAARQISATLH